MRSDPGRASRLLLATLAIVIGALASCRVPPPPVFEGMLRRTQWVMGTRLTIAVPGAAGPRVDRVLRRAFAVARDYERVLSDYRPDSALSRLNTAAGRGATPVAPRLYAFLSASQRWAKRTHGAFDLVVGALTHRLRRRRYRPADRARLVKAVGARLLELGPGRRARLAHPEARLDPGGIGKGYAVDRVIEYLRGQGVGRAFVDFGGSTFYGLGSPSGRRGWPVLLRSATPGRFLGVVLLRDESLSSSLSRRPDGRTGRRREPHIFDPRSGRLVAEPRFAAVVAPTATATDALSTALVVAPGLGREALRRGEAAVMQRAGAAPVWTPGMRSHLAPRR